MRPSRDKIFESAKKLNNTCQVCDDPSPEIQIILISLKNKLAIKIKEIAEDYEMNEDRNNTKPINAFYSLLNIVFGQEIFSFSKTDLCNHSKLFLQFKKKLRCTQKILKEASQALSYDLGSRNYHFQLLNQQIASVLTRVEKRFEPKSVSKMKIPKKQSRHHSVELKWLRKKKQSVKNSQKMNQVKNESSQKVKKQMLMNDIPFDEAQKQNNPHFARFWCTMPYFFPLQNF